MTATIDTKADLRRRMRAERLAHSEALPAQVRALIFHRPPRPVLDLMPEAEPMFGEDEITDKSQRFLAGELVREQLMRRLGEELPYSTTVEVEKFEEEPSPKTGVMYRIDAVIWVEREGQKAIVIGKGGERLRDIGQHARKQMEYLFGAKVFLQTWVRVREGWSDDEAALRALGYHD